MNYTSMTSEVKSRPRILQCAIEALRSRAVISSFESEFCICRGRRKRPRIGGLSIDVLVRMSSRPRSPLNPKKRNGQSLVENRFAREAIARLAPSNSFDRCNYATSERIGASDRRVHEVLTGIRGSGIRSWISATSLLASVVMIAKGAKPFTRSRLLPVLPQPTNAERAAVLYGDGIGLLGLLSLDRFLG